MLEKCNIFVFDLILIVQLKDSQPECGNVISRDGILQLCLERLDALAKLCILAFKLVDPCIFGSIICTSTIAVL